MSAERYRYKRCHLAEGCGGDEVCAALCPREAPDGRYAELGEVIREEDGIHFWIRRKMLQAYESEGGMVELQRLIEAGQQHIAPELLSRLRDLTAEGATQDGS